MEAIGRQLGRASREVTWYSEGKVLVWTEFFSSVDRRFEMAIEQNTANLSWSRAPIWVANTREKPNHHSNLYWALDTVLKAQIAKGRGNRSHEYLDQNLGETYMLRTGLMTWTVNFFPDLTLAPFGG